MTARPTLSARRRMHIWQLRKGICHICGQKIDGGHERWEVEHIVPWELSRDDSDDNLGLAHTSCHKPKTAEDTRAIRKAERQRQRSAGIKKTRKGRPLPGCKDSEWKSTLYDGWVRR